MPPSPPRTLFDGPGEDTEINARHPPPTKSLQSGIGEKSSGSQGEQ